MRFMMTFTAKPENADTIASLIPAEQQRAAEMRQAGEIEQVYLSGAERAWVVLVADSASAAEQLAATLPLYPYVGVTIEPLRA